MAHIHDAERVMVLPRGGLMPSLLLPPGVRTDSREPCGSSGQRTAAACGRQAKGKSEVVVGIEEADVSNQAAECLAIVGQQAAPHVLAEEVAQEAAEVLVP